ncbi:hypothetical protein Plav_0904 [Parvibaculum lavamentivorans DS-1]|uniref:Uncharacterized protein n=2 Tax=Parvibaculum lavamentivorans TaxID=256618 RepID=A7HRJ4_PARL1|nr:hypothetical protein Plav_0904 [Parvibaculum lavamentivorans DS-1]
MARSKRLRLEDVSHRGDEADHAEDHEDEARALSTHLVGEEKQHERDDETEGAVRREFIALDRDEGGDGAAFRAGSVFGPDEQDGPAGQHHAHDEDHPFVARHLVSSFAVEKGSGEVEMTAYTKDGERAWHLDRRVPIAVIVTLLLQSAAALVWAGSANERLSTLEVRAVRIDEMVERTARLEERAKAASAALERIEARLAR